MADSRVGQSPSVYPLSGPPLFSSPFIVQPQNAGASPLFPGGPVWIPPTAAAPPQQHMQMVMVPAHVPLQQLLSVPNAGVQALFELELVGADGRPAEAGHGQPHCGWCYCHCCGDNIAYLPAGSHPLAGVPPPLRGIIEDATWRNWATRLNKSKQDVCGMLPFLVFPPVVGICCVLVYNLRSAERSEEIRAEFDETLARHGLRWVQRYRHWLPGGKGGRQYLHPYWTLEYSTMLAAQWAQHLSGHGPKPTLQRWEIDYKTAQPLERECC